MLNRKTIIAVLVFIFAGLMIFTFANPNDPATNEEDILIEELNDATDAVEQAETSLLQADVNSARILVNDLPDGDDKDSLSDRLDEVQKIIDAILAVEKAEDSELEEDVNSARDLVDDLLPSDIKDELNARLDAIDFTLPVITLNGSATITNLFGVPYLELGATATDDKDGNITARIVTTGVVNVNALGSYTITYAVSDNSGKTASVSRVVNVVDNTVPTITLNGEAIINHPAGTPYVELGATASDNESGLLTSSILTFGGVNVNALGTYTIVYTVSDDSGNTSSVSRVVNVIDKSLPVVSFNLNGNDTYAKSHNTVVTATDLYTDIVSLKYIWSTSNVAPLKEVFLNNFNSGDTLSTPDATGDYYLWIYASDEALNETIVSSNIFKLDNNGPEIILASGEEVRVPICIMFMSCPKINYDVTSAIDAELNIDYVAYVVNTEINVNRYEIGEYFITYTVSDDLTNESSVTMKVIVEPIITFVNNGDNDYEKNHKAYIDVIPSSWSNYKNLNRNSLKYVWTNSSERPSDDLYVSSTEIKTVMTWYGMIENIISSPTDLNGEYYLHVYVEDIFGNKTYKTSNKFMFDNIAPVITLNGDAIDEVEKAGSKWNPVYYQDPGVTVTDNVDTDVDVDTNVQGEWSNKINLRKIDEYTIEYTATDDAGNESSITREVHVVNELSEEEV